MTVPDRPGRPRRSRAASARRLAGGPAPPPAGRARAAPGRPRSAGWCSPTSARWRPVLSTRSGRRLVHAATSSPSRRSRTTSTSSTTEVYRDDRHPHGRDGGARHGHRRRPRLPDRVLHGPRRLAPDARAARRLDPLPLWAGYLVKVYAWRLILSRERRRSNWVLEPVRADGPGLRRGRRLARLAYLWLPYMILPIYAGLERIPSSLLEASADLGGRTWHDLPAGRPAARLPGGRGGLDLHVLADARRLHHADLVSTRSSSATSSTTSSGLAGNLPLAAAYAMVPVAIMLVYLLVARRLGAFEAL